MNVQKKKWGRERNRYREGNTKEANKRKDKRIVNERDTQRERKIEKHERKRGERER